MAVIGTGATAVQLIPEAAKAAESLTVFQRTPIWVVPKVDFPIPPPVQRMFRRVPLTQKAARVVNTSMLELLMVAGVLHHKQLKPGNSPPSCWPRHIFACRSATGSYGAS